MPSTETTRRDQGSIFILTGTKGFFTGAESPTDSDLLAHGSLHAFGIARGANGYPNNLVGLLLAEDDVNRMMYALKNKGSTSNPTYMKYGEAAVSALFNSRLVSTLREGARKYAIGR